MRFIISLLLFFAIQAAADEPEKEKPNAIKEIFEKFDGPLRLQGIVEFPFYSFYLGAPAIQGVAYVPSFAPRLGPRILWEEVGLTMTFALPIPETEQHRRGTSDITGVILNSYWRQNAIDLYYMRIKGFYVTSPFRELSVHKPARYPQLPEALVTNTGFNWYYVFHPDRFSLKAAFDQSEFQTRSGYSLIVSPFYNHLEMSLGTRFIPGDGDNSITGIPALASGRFDAAGASIGYGATYIYERFFASWLSLVGPGFQYQRFGRSDGRDITSLNWTLKINVNASAGLNFKTYVGGLKFLVDSLSARVGGEEVASNLITGQVFLGARF